MGFECKFHYHEKVDGDYNRDEVKVFSRKVGDPLDDVPLEKLAGSIMAQYARRDIFIVDVEVYEISKKQVSFKETKGGVVLKNRKFLFDHGAEPPSVSVEETETNCSLQAPPATQHPHQQINLSAAQSFPHNAVAARPSGRPIDAVMFAPEPQQLFEAKKKGYKLTVDKKYPVFKKRMSPTGIGEILTISDDAGREIEISDVYFVPGNINLIADRELGFSESKQDMDGGRLMWGNAVDDNMPDLRRR